MYNRQASSFLTLVVRLALIFAPSYALAAPPSAEPIREAGDIRGMLTFCGHPAQNAVVSIRGTSYSAITDANGAFELGYVQQGVYDLTVKKDGMTRGTIRQIAVAPKQLTDTGTTDLCVDLDGDGFSLPADCNDGNPNIYPGAAESCGDGVDDNCDGAIDEGCQACTDNDGDGFFGQGGCGTAVDCSDTAAAVNPQAVEVCDGVDNNCDGAVDEGLDQPIANGVLRCAGGSHTVRCQAGFADCNAFSGDGCETDLNSDLGNCGQCGNICDDGNSETAEMCASGTCMSL